MIPTKTEWYFIVNPHAGSGKTMGQWIPAEQKLDKMGVPYVTAYTDHKRHATALAYDAAEKGYRKILAVGGDGSLHETYNGLMKWCDDTGTDPSDFRLAVAPIGSGNDWIKSTHIPHDVMKVADMLEDGPFSLMDVVRVESAGGKVNYMANIGGLGFDSHVCQRVNIQKEGGKRGKRIYLDALLHTMIHLSSIRIQVIADGKEVFNGEAYSMAMGNGRYSGSGMRQVPKAEFDDGLLDVMIVPKISLMTMLKELPKLFTGTVDTAKPLVYFKCREMDVIPLDSASEDVIEIDGEIDGRLPMKVTVQDRKAGILCGKEE